MPGTDHGAPQPSMLVAVPCQIRELRFRHASFAGSAGGIFHTPGQQRESTSIVPGRGAGLQLSHLQASGLDGRRGALLA